MYTCYVWSLLFHVPFQSEYSDLESRYKQCVSELEQLKGREQEAELRRQYEDLSFDNSRLTQELDSLRVQLAEQEERAREGEMEKTASLEKEVKQLSEEVSVVKDESTALRYQLSSATMELQQTKEVHVLEKNFQFQHLS